MQKFVIRVFTCQNMAIFRNPSKFLNFFEFSKKNLIQIFSRVFKVTKKTVFTEITLQMWPWKIIENDQNFCRIFRFWAEISNFLVQNFFHVFYTSRPSFVQKISSLLWKPDFLSIFIDFGRKLPILGDPPLLWTPCPDPPMIRTCPEKISYGPKRIVGNLQKISGRYGQR